MEFHQENVKFVKETRWDSMETGCHVMECPWSFMYFVRHENSVEYFTWNPMRVSVENFMFFPTEFEGSIKLGPQFCRDALKTLTPTKKALELF